MRSRAITCYSRAQISLPKPQAHQPGVLRTAPGVSVPTGPDTPVPRAFAAKRLGVSPHTISMWVQRGWIDRNGNRRTVHVLGKQGRERLYRWGDLMDAEADTRRSINSPRNPRRRPAAGARSWDAVNRKPQYAPA